MPRKKAPLLLPKKTLTLIEKMKDSVLGKNYALELILASPALSQSLNKQYRKKDYPTDILSFPLGSNAGQIFLDLTTAEKEAPKFDRELPNFILFLIIHGLWHLKGMSHGSTMEAMEVETRNTFSI